MKISENSVNLGQQAYARELESTKPPEQTKAEAPKAEAPKAEAPKAVEDRVSLSANARDIQIAKNAVEATPEIREEAVQDLKKDVDAGTYKIDSDKIADKMVGSNIDELV